MHSATTSDTTKCEKNCDNTRQRMAQIDTEWKMISRNDKKRVMRRRGRPSLTGNKAQEHQSLNQTSQHVEDSDLLRSYIETCQESLSILLEQIMALVDDDMTIQEIVCYGIGNFSRTSGHYFSASFWQLALVLRLRSTFNVPLLYYDPCTTQFETEFLEQMGVQVISRDEKGVRTSAHTLFFMPHCPSGLYENVLWSNWRHLKSIFIFGNSLKSYSEGLQFDGPCITAIQPWLREDVIRWSNMNASGDVEGAFNDTFLSQIKSGEKDDFPERPYDNLREEIAIRD
ncbi:hypothetical protein FisN_1Hh076 [Fistulifera solaris]|uniref:SRR1-like domain-containing protein n=1 Tax=Fistulifera solaris TaxID=1519565 RepID=A0A1Z5JEG0_FISSO|nr:hypothetical protein FisN_1Hh076 [Fistulifera solaris]|eukprot:GAX12151.1 hypothetical protein FisN_1Hh076 [Fistulifera solaris]